MGEPSAWNKVLVKLQFIPIEVTNQYMTGELTYKGYSPLFDEVEEWNVTPLYTISLTRNKRGLSVKAERHD